VRARWLAALVMALALAGGALVALQPAPSRATADFMVLVSAGRLALHGHADRVYDQAWLAPEIVRSAAGASLDPRLPFNEPLAAVLPFAALAALPVDLGLRLWQAFSVLLMLAALALLQAAAPLGRWAPLKGIVALMASAPAWSLLLEGQVSAVLLLGAALMALAVLRRRPLIALPGAALLALKPQYLLAYLVILVALRRPRAVAAALAGGGAVLMSPLIAGGIPALAAMVHNALSTDQVTPVRLSESWAGLLAAVLPAGLQTPVALALLACAMVVILALGRKASGDPLPLIAAASWIGVLASPHCLPHDLVLLAVPAWCALALHRQGRIPSPLWGLAACDAAVLLDELHPAVVLGPLVMTLVLAAYAVAFRRRSTPDLESRPAAA
jgi:glycosyl transferase family 87